MNQQMFPPAYYQNSFEWFENQHKIHDGYLSSNNIESNFSNYYQTEVNRRNFQNSIQPVPQQPSQQMQHQGFQMMGTTQPSLPTNGFGGSSSTNFGQGGYSYYPTNSGGHYPSSQTNAYQNEGLGSGYPTQSSPQVQNYSNQFYSNPYSEQTSYQSQYDFIPQTQQQIPQSQMSQFGPFVSPTMFAPSTPYPTQPKVNQQQNSNNQTFQFSSILNQFKNSSGSYDVPKMMNTAGQVMNTMNQVGGLFKQLGTFFK